MINKSFFLSLILSFTIQLNAQKPVVADVKVQGNEKLKSSFVKKIASLKSGDVLDSLRIEEDMRFLKRLPSISHASYQVFPAEDNTYNVFYNIEENVFLVFKKYDRQSVAWMI